MQTNVHKQTEYQKTYSTNTLSVDSTEWQVMKQKEIKGIDVSGPIWI